MPGIGGSGQKNDLRELQIMLRIDGGSSASATVDRD
tara:strand:- start:163 stop:270 length:108 start_codon:yes stop_codon:yes gene_type:complete